MGGTRKKSIGQIERQQALKERKEKAEKDRRKKEEKVERDRSVSMTIAFSKQLEAIKNETASSGYITPYLLASKLNLRLSIAKQLLREASSRGIINPVSKSSRTAIYTIASS